MKKHKTKYAKKWKDYVKTAEIAVQEAEAAVIPEKESPSEQAGKKIINDLSGVMKKQRDAVLSMPRISRIK